ncbi:helix-turn-helix domain-containing protein (plasmid) [Methanocaldococcus indicus]|uniref:helix-turn-helix domain-containing protein n=1 Tax=Methanocaldococcus indicus TaxID=213231 RepID=UPI0039C9F6E0
MIIKLNKIVSWDKIKEIYEKADSEPVILKISPCLLEKMKYKIKYLEKHPLIFIDAKYKKRGRPKKVTPELIEKMKSMWMEGYSLSIIAENFNLSKSTVYYYLNDFIFENKKDKLLAMLEKFMIHAVDEGWFNENVKEYFKLACDAVKNDDLEKANYYIDKLIYIRYMFIDNISLRKN